MEKKEIRISVSTLIIVVIALILAVAVVIMGIHIVNQNKNKELQQEKESKSNISSNSTNIQKNNVIELDLNSKIVEELTEKIGIADEPIKEYIYKLDSFTNKNIPNDLILQMGYERAVWIHASEREQLFEIVTTDDGMDVLSSSISSENMKKCIQDIFGKNIKYSDETFEIKWDEEKYDYILNIKMVYENGKYLKNLDTNLFPGGYEPCNYTIDEFIEKALKYDDKIEIYVKPAFAVSENNTDGTRNKEIIYNDYKLEKSNKVDEIPFRDYDNMKYSIDTLLPNVLNCKYMINNNNNIVNKLNTYVYTFELDSTNGEYYLSAFYKV